MKQKPYKFVARLPLNVRDRVVEAAHQYRRSINSEIVARLEQSFSDCSQSKIAPPLHPHLEHVLRGRLDDTEKRLIDSFRRLGTKKREALMTLLD